LKATCLTVDHRPDHPGEKQRVEALGAKIMTVADGSLRLNGKIGVTRSLGDLTDPFIAPFLGREPDVLSLDLKRGQGGMRTLVLACDGLWDVITEQEVGEIVSNQLGKVGVGKIAEELMNKAYDRGSEDNISVVLVDLSCL